MANYIFVSVDKKLKKVSWVKNVKAFTKKVFSKLNYTNEELSIFFCDNETIKSLNENYRNIAKPTDVLSFEDGNLYERNGKEIKMLGDIAISVDAISENAKAFSVSENEEAKRLLIHGILHLHGFDHGNEHLEKNKKQTCEMLCLQEKLVDEFKEEIIFSN